MQIPAGRLAFSAIILLAGSLSSLPQDQVARDDQSIRVIDIGATKYEFTPDEIHVKKGKEVQLKVHSVDEAHGIKLSLYPEGSKDKSSPGLLFTDPRENGKVEKDKDQVLEFVAQQAGTYQFKCAKFCGFGHGRMKGRLVVDE